MHAATHISATYAVSHVNCILHATGHAACCRKVYRLNVRAGGDPQTAGVGTFLKQPLFLDPVPDGCSEADPLLWSPFSSNAAASQPRHRAATQPRCAAGPAAVSAQGFTVLPCAHGQHQPAEHSGKQRVPWQGQLNPTGVPRMGSNTQISAHRVAAASAPITIDGRQHDWWTLQLQEQRTGFVAKQVKARRMAALHACVLTSGHFALTADHSQGGT